MRIHELKTDSPVFQEVVKGKKTFEIRKDDRGFVSGDFLLLKETLYTGQEMKEGKPLSYTGQSKFVRVKHKLGGGIYGLAEGWCILSIEHAPPEFSSRLPRTDIKYGDLIEMRSHEYDDWEGPYFYLGEIKEHRTIWKDEDGDEVEWPQTHFAMRADCMGFPKRFIYCHRYVRPASREMREQMENQTDHFMKVMESLES